MAAASRSVASRNPWRCIGCDTQTDQLLYCTALCRDTAGAIRYRRRVEKDGRIEQQDVRDALTIREAHVLWGQVYQVRLTSDERAAVLSSKGGRCLSCGAPATVVDHIASAFHGDDSLANLQPLCEACHRAKTLKSVMPWDTTSPDARNSLRVRRAEYDRRCKADTPERLCDDEQRWPALWPSIRAARKRARENQSQAR
jgi:5-methylcytosine-specific restriction endonuclease McrA